MELLNWTKRAAIAAALGAVVSSGYAADTTDANMSTELQALKARIAELEKKEDANWLTDERTAQIKAIVNDAIADAKTRGQFADSDLQAGYKNGFFIQTADGKNKLTICGFLQFRYVYSRVDAKHSTSAPNASDVGNASGFDIRRARVSFAGTVFSPDIFYKFEGDFAGSSSNSGNFQVTDAYAGYSITDMFKVKAGSFKVPFTKVELVSDTNLGLMERPEVNLPFDAQRAVGVSLFGDIVKDKVSYEANVNNGSKSNTLGRIDDTGGALDNRLAFYGRTQWAGAGAISDFSDEPDLRKDNSTFAWMLGAAAGYESQNAVAGSFPASQTATSLVGLSSNTSPGFLSNTALNGDLYRATVDWSGKYQGWQFNTAAYFQQANQNQNQQAAAPNPAPYGRGNSSFFEYGYYGQVGYFILPKKLELVGRAGQLTTEGLPNSSQYYTLGANYYLFGNNVKLQGDVTFVPDEAAYTDAASDVIANKQDLTARVQFQVKF